MNKRRGYSLLDVVVSLTILMTLILPFTGMIQTTGQSLLKAEELSKATDLLDKIVHQVQREKIPTTGEFMEDDFEISLLESSTKYPQIREIHIQIRKERQLVTQTSIFRRILPEEGDLP